MDCRVKPGNDECGRVKPTGKCPAAYTHKTPSHVRFRANRTLSDNRRMTASGPRPGIGSHARQRGDLLRPCDCSYDDLSEFDQVAGRVREEGKLAADGVEFERLGHDLDTAGSEIGDGLRDIRHVDAEVVITGVAETIAKV